MWERFGRTPDLRLVFDGVEDLIDRYPKWGEVEFQLTPLARFGNTLMACEQQSNCGLDSSSGGIVTSASRPWAIVLGGDWA